MDLPAPLLRPAADRRTDHVEALRIARLDLLHALSRLYEKKEALEKLLKENVNESC